MVFPCCQPEGKGLALAAGVFIHNRDAGTRTAVPHARHMVPIPQAVIAQLAAGVGEQSPAVELGAERPSTFGRKEIARVSGIY